MQPNSNRARDKAYVVHQHTNLAIYDRDGGTLITGGDGVYVTDEDGKRYLEAMAGMWSASLGFSEHRLAEVAYRQMKALPYYHTFYARGHLPSVDLAETLLAIAPRQPGAEPLTKVMFHCSGSESNDTAIKLIWYYHNAIGKPNKKRIIGRHRGYHGCTIATASVSGNPTMHQDFDLPLPGFLHADNPHYYRFHEEGESEEAFSQRMADNLERLILDNDPGTIAAFFAEPVQGGGGAITPPARYFELIQPILKKYDILFLVDEVICGFGRTGSLWGCQTYDLRPDLVTCGKALSASYQPISALMLTQKIFDAMMAESEKLGSFAHGYTHSAHPVACAVALETLNIYESDGTVEHVRRVAPVFLDGLRSLLDHPMMGDVRGVGLFAGVELMADGGKRIPFPPALKVGQQVQDECQALGLIVRCIGDRIALTPPLIITADEVAELVRLFRQGLDNVWARIRDDQRVAAV
ncbi:aminotransferase class III-fold pyridoxal phosphate-dependent enzyme [Methylobacterium terricola]|uniref:Aminotransferase class III-fold pyridoxal phosphate-dependent enzyme n=1 Tax=Methylobacterium terricola TaxID=2583531 RepID=A0A5C4L8F8_9HYPH|nr:aminotransferase [Methylobacterium terricola]TNC07302.1 aminotransferase class III-fold pyridoxal phosphate-dependent enzyme [Methylobacterium terricola]